MDRVLVIGCPGSGKSTFSRALAEKTGFSLVHLDRLYWNADRTTVEKQVFRRRLEDALEGESWIIDGDYASTMELRLQRCDTVFFLDYPEEVCLSGVRDRIGKPRADLPWLILSLDPGSGLGNAPLPPNRKNPRRLNSNLSAACRR